MENAWKKWEVVHSRSIGDLMESISFTFSEGILFWSHWVSKFQRLQCYRIWTGKLPSNVTLPHNNSFPTANVQKAVEGSSLICQIRVFFHNFVFSNIPSPHTGIISCFWGFFFVCVSFGVGLWCVWLLFLNKHWILSCQTPSQSWWGLELRKLDLCKCRKLSGSLCRIAPQNLFSCQTCF